MTTIPNDFHSRFAACLAKQDQTEASSLAAIIEGATTAGNARGFDGDLAKLRSIALGKGAGHVPTSSTNFGTLGKRMDVAPPDLGSLDLQKFANALTLPPQLRQGIAAATEAFDAYPTGQRKDAARAVLKGVHAEVSAYIDGALQVAALMKATAPSRGMTPADFYRSRL